MIKALPGNRQGFFLWPDSFAGLHE